MIAQLEDSIGRVARWVESHAYAAYDPGDGNLSYLNALTFDVLFLERVLQQLVYRAPINLRPLLGIRPHTSTKGMGYMAWGYLTMYRTTGVATDAERARHCLDWLLKNRSPFYPQFCWGNHFPFSTRSGKTPALEPIIPWTTLIGQAFIQAHQVFDEPRYLDIIRSVATWILSLPREVTGSGSCISYVAFKQNSIHNSNMLAAAFLAQAGRLLNDAESLRVASEAMQYSCSRQRADGAWLYGEEPKYHWIDNFHTGYNLDALQRYAEATGDDQFDTALTAGEQFYRRHFFESDGRPRYYHDRTYPTDIQCAAQSIDSLVLLSKREPQCLNLSQKVAAWTIANMQDSDGHFYYRDLGWIKVTTPMLHWGQGTMFKALAHLLSRLKGDLRATPRKPTRETVISR